MQSVKKNIYFSLALLLVFVGCCAVMFVWGRDMTSTLVVVPFMMLWGFSALAWPAFAVRAFRQYLASR